MKVNLSKGVKRTKQMFDLCRETDVLKRFISPLVQDPVEMDAEELNEHLINSKTIIMGLRQIEDDTLRQLSDFLNDCIED